VPKTMALILKTVPVFDDASTSSRRLGRAQKGKRFPFVKQQEDVNDPRTDWYQIEFEGKESWVVESSHRHNYVDLVDGEDGEGIEQPSLEPPAISGDLVDWGDFLGLLPSYHPQTYKQKGAQMPIAPKGLQRCIAKRHIGSKYTNCSLFTCSLVTNAMDTAITTTLYGWWQVYASSKGTSHGPGAAVAAGFATMVPEPKKTAPKDGVYLVQDFTRWPKGHSYLVLDWDPKTGKMLTLEASSWTINGAGFKGIGNLRDVDNPGKDWAKKARKDITWQKRRSDYPECYTSRLHVDYETVRAWLRRA